jgi:ABC-type uncharacterized transport system auxiliary subunit
MKTSHIVSRRTAISFVAALLAAVCALSGCVSRPSLHKQTFTFTAPATDPTNVVAGDRVLAIRRLQIAPPFDGRSLVYRTGEFSYARDPYAEFLDSPAEEMTAPVRTWLRGDGGFSAVVERGSALTPGTLVEINVTRLFGDFRRPEHSAAVIGMQFVFFDAPNGVPGKPLFQKEYSRDMPLSAPTAAALMAGWNQALADILAEAASDLRHSEANDGSNSWPLVEYSHESPGSPANPK